MKSALWLKLPDVDFLDDHRISLFSNNTRSYGARRRHESVEDRDERATDVTIRDFATGAAGRPWRNAFLSLQMQTYFEDLADTMPDGSLMVEETNRGRLLFLSKDGDLIAQYLSCASVGRVYRLVWNRYIGQGDGDALVAVLEKVSCND